MSSDGKKHRLRGVLGRIKEKMHVGGKSEKNTSPTKRTIETTEVKYTSLDSDLVREVPASPPSSPQVFDTGLRREKDYIGSPTMLRSNLAAAPIVTVTSSDRAPIITTTQTPSTTIIAPLPTATTTTTTVSTTVVEPIVPIAGAPLLAPIADDIKQRGMQREFMDKIASTQLLSSETIDRQLGLDQPKFDTPLKPVQEELTQVAWQKQATGAFANIEERVASNNNFQQLSNMDQRTLLQQEFQERLSQHPTPSDVTEHVDSRLQNKAPVTGDTPLEQVQHEFIATVRSNPPSSTIGEYIDQRVQNHKPVSSGVTPMEQVQQEFQQKLATNPPSSMVTEYVDSRVLHHQVSSGTTPMDQVQQEFQHKLQEKPISPGVSDWVDRTVRQPILTEDNTPIAQVQGEFMNKLSERGATNSEYIDYRVQQSMAALPKAGPTPMEQVQREFKQKLEDTPIYSEDIEHDVQEARDRKAFIRGENRSTPMEVVQEEFIEKLGEHLVTRPLFLAEKIDRDTLVHREEMKHRPSEITPIEKVESEFMSKLIKLPMRTTAEVEQEVSQNVSLTNALLPSSEKTPVEEINAEIQSTLRNRTIPSSLSSDIDARVEKNRKMDKFMEWKMQDLMEDTWNNPGKKSYTDLEIESLILGSMTLKDELNRDVLRMGDRVLNGQTGRILSPQSVKNVLFMEKRKQITTKQQLYEWFLFMLQIALFPIWLLVKLYGRVSDKVSPVVHKYWPSRNRGQRLEAAQEAEKIVENVATPLKKANAPYPNPYL
jgi:hypothetical protein